MKKIGIVGRSFNGMFGIQAPYYDYLSKFGDVEVINPLITFDVTDVNRIDLLVLPGGPDIYPNKPSVYTGKPDLFLEHFDNNWLHRFMIISQVPTLGICRGMQAINKYFGGGITQHVDLPTSSPRQKEVEIVTLADGATIEVNSLHHQAIYQEQVADSLDIIGISEHQNVEIISHPEYKILGVQFHPEEMNI